jgi:hypothetical protein
MHCATPAWIAAWNKPRMQVVLAAVVPVLRNRSKSRTMALFSGGL